MQNSATKKFHLALAKPGFASTLAEEFLERFQIPSTIVDDAAIAIDEKYKLPTYDDTIFTRQYLPRSTPFATDDVKAAAAFILKRLEVTTGRSNRQTGRWTLHAFALDHDPGTERAGQIEKALLALVKTKIPRLYKRYVDPDLFAEAPCRTEDFIVQVYIPSLGKIYVSTAGAKSGLSVYPAGIRRMRHRVGAPSRSARKLEEAYLCLGRTPKARETAVDLGAAPGGWSFSLARHGAQVSAIDHADLCIPEDAKLAGEITHLRENGLKYISPVPVDWLCCDMVIAPQETLRVLAYWLQKEWMNTFVVNVKLPAENPWPAVKEALKLIESCSWPLIKARHLYHDRSEITLFGSRLLAP